ncbi:hypothetical protein SAMN05428974_2641 [Sphingopyxis sp. YR583]|jgi:hypothetical protein|uniref:hypothetical protein n=1 Tax=Sphingopyxis sp. YR583 TaxID=1881047 RepID=UPI0008A7DAB9|nr:hypothetical protein [Sphingopyxis sp. YR583]SEH18408.1 hypothetical protein SAMN05428974_2641 [Sphingopyxis sp. YR583]
MPDPLDMTGLWTGRYWYPEPWEPATGFVATINDNAGSLSGTTTEASDLIDGDERADIRGIRVGTAVSFHKYYDGDGAYGHSVTYDGVLSRDGQQVEGHWAIDDYSGAFLMYRNLQSVQHEELEESAEIDVT